MALEPQLRTSIPANRRGNSRSIHPTLKPTSSPVHEMGGLQIHLRSAVERLTSSTATASTTDPRVAGEQSCGDSDAGSNYGDVKVDEAEITETATQPVSEPGSPGERRHHGMCSPGSYAEFTVNPYSFTAVGRLPDPTPHKSDEPKQDYFSLPRRASQKRTSADVPEACQKAVRPRTENMDETLKRLSSNLNSAYSAIQAEESASLRFLRELCA
ncbi:hypothetical protein F5Y05DRAFT_387911 [Hypoxylon sp. FL0543]|nr:hypothetical protein F5Y05DRAFT_387911 [Hypoxylon sp. FL0543]